MEGPYQSSQRIYLTLLEIPEKGTVSLFVGGPDFGTAMLFFMLNEEILTVNILSKEEVTDKQMHWIQNYRFPN